MKIFAPVAKPAEVGALADAGAHELYAGITTPSLLETYSESFSINARALAGASLLGMDQLEASLDRSDERGLPLWLTFNQALLDEQFAEVCALIDACAQTRVTGLVLSDPSLALHVAERHPHLSLDVSCMGQVWNDRAVDFWTGLGARRITLPRALTRAEMTELAGARPKTEFCFLAMGDGCFFVNGLCSPIHGGIRRPRTARAAGNGRGFPAPWIAPLRAAGSWLRTRLRERCRPLRGEFCTRSFRITWPGTGRIDPSIALRGPLWAHDRSCAACSLPQFLTRPNLALAKVAGRIFPTAEKVARCRFLREAMEVAARGLPRGETCRAMEELYRREWGRDCGRRACYYPS